MKNGLIYILIDWLLEKLKYINLVELFKFIVKKMYNKDTLLASRAGVDIFIFSKWATIIILWAFHVNSSLVNILIWYLICTNIYTYFYYHTWTKELEKGFFDHAKIKRRFLNLMLAISFNIACFAYLFAIPFSTNYQWTGQVSSTKDALHLEVYKFKDVRHQDSCLCHLPDGSQGRQVQYNLIQKYFAITNCRCLHAFQLQTEQR